jgi:hypothetical protein
MSLMMTVTENSARNFNSATVHWAKSSSKATPLNPHTKQKISKQKRKRTIQINTLYHTYNFCKYFFFRKQILKGFKN